MGGEGWTGWVWRAVSGRATMSVLVVSPPPIVIHSWRAVSARPPLRGYARRAMLVFWNPDRAPADKTLGARNAPADSPSISIILRIIRDPLPFAPIGTRNRM